MAATTPGRFLPHKAAHPQTWPILVNSTKDGEEGHLHLLGPLHLKQSLSEGENAEAEWYIPDSDFEPGVGQFLAMDKVLISTSSSIRKRNHVRSCEG